MKLHAYVKGRVQGVGFRYFVRAVADEMNLDGWVKNLPDGRVELEAVGYDGELDRLEELLQQGPPGAHVDAVTVMRGEGEPEGRGFRIEFW